MIESKNRRVDKDTSVRDAIEEERERDRRWRVNYEQFSASRREQVTASEAYVCERGRWREVLHAL